MAQGSLLHPVDTHSRVKFAVKVTAAHEAISFFWVMGKWPDFATSCGFTKINFLSLQSDFSRFHFETGSPSPSQVFSDLDPPLGKLPIVPLLPSSL